MAFKNNQKLNYLFDRMPSDSLSDEETQMDNKEELPSLEKTAYHMNGTLMNLNKEMKQINESLKEVNKNIGIVAKAIVGVQQAIEIANRK